MDEPLPRSGYTGDPPPDNGTRAHAGEERRPHVLFRVLLVMLAVCALWALLLPWVSGMLPDDSQVGPSRWVTAVMTTVLVVPMIWLARRHLDRRPWRGLGMTGPRQGWWPFLVGVLAWVLPAFTGVALVTTLGRMEIVPLLPTGELVLSLVGLLCLVLLFEAVPEELIFRGYLFTNLNTVMSAWLTVVAQAVLFTLFGTALWVLAEGWDVLAERGPLFFGLAVVLGCLRVVTGNVWACVGFHLAFQSVAQAVLNDELLTIRGDQDVFMLCLLLPFVFGVLVTVLLTRRGGDWGARVPDDPASVRSRPNA